MSYLEQLMIPEYLIGVYLNGGGGGGNASGITLIFDVGHDWK